MRNAITMCVCVSADMRERLRTGAQENGLTVSGYINLLLRRGMKVMEVDNGGKTGLAEPGPAE